MWFLEQSVSRYAPARGAILQAWRELQKTGPMNVDTVAAIIFRGLDLLSGQPLQDDWKIWTSNCGRGVSRHMGPHDLPKRIGLVRPVGAGKAKGGAASKAKQSKAKKHGRLHLVASGRAYAKCSVSDSVRRALQQHMDFGIKLAKCKAYRSW